MNKARKWIPYLLTLHKNFKEFPFTIINKLTIYKQIIAGNEK